MSGSLPRFLLRAFSRLLPSPASPPVAAFDLRPRRSRGDRAARKGIALWRGGETGRPRWRQTRVLTGATLICRAVQIFYELVETYKVRTILLPSAGPGDHHTAPHLPSVFCLLPLRAPPLPTPPCLSGHPHPLPPPMIRHDPTGPCERALAAASPSRPPHTHPFCLRLQNRGVGLYVTHLKRAPRASFEDAGVVRLLGEEAFCKDVASAMASVERAMRERDH